MAKLPKGKPPKPAPKDQKAASDNKSTAPTKKSATSANTPGTVFLDTFNKHPDCKKDKDKIAKECAPKPEKQKQDEKTRKGGMLRHIRQVTSKIDKVGQKYVRYKKGSPAENSWMDDHCDGMWVKPQFGDMKEFDKELGNFKKDLDNLGATVDSLLKNPGKVLEAGYSQLASQAVEKLGHEAVEEMLLKKLGQDVLLALLPVGKAGALAKVGAVMKAGVSGASYLDTAEKLVAALGTDHAKDLLQSMKFLVTDADKRFGELAKVWQDKPDAVMAELMSVNAEFDACLRAKKCQLVPYKSNTKANTKKGEGCCPGQTAHHVIPDSAAKSAGCEDYKYGTAPTICLEGQDNNFGSHGRAHTKLDMDIKDYNGVGKPPKPISYDKMRDKSLDAIKDSTEQCNRACLRAQLDSYYTKCGDLQAKSGKGGAIPGSKETKPADDE